MLKEAMFKCIIDTMVQTKDGQLSILINPRRSQLQDSIEISDSISIDHSLLNLNFQ